MTRPILAPVALIALSALVGGCTHDLDVRLLSDQRLPVGSGRPIVLRAAHGGTVQLLDQATHRTLYSGLVTTGDDVTLDPVGDTVKVRGRVVSDDLRPNDVVQISFD